MSDVTLKRVPTERVRSQDEFLSNEISAKDFLTALLHTQVDRGNTTLQINDGFSIEAWALDPRDQFEHETLPTVQLSLQ